MMTLTDNTLYSSTPNNIETFLSLQNIANKKISDILDENDNNLLIYPYSFDKCEDGIGQQCLLSLQTHWKEKQCTKATLQTGNIIGFFHPFTLFTKSRRRLLLALYASKGFVYKHCQPFTWYNRRANIQLSALSIPKTSQ